MVIRNFVCLCDYPRIYRSEKIVQTEATPNNVGELAIDKNTTIYFTLYCIYTECQKAQMCAYWPTISILVSKYTKSIACKKLLIWYQ
jgi:hypothetical protein